MRDIVCDFCSVALTSHEEAWDCPARSFDTGVADPHGFNRYSFGGWCACRRCARFVRRGARDELVERAVNAATLCDPDAASFKRELTIALRELHDQFWANREGDPMPVTLEVWNAYRDMPGQFIEYTDQPRRTAQWVRDFDQGKL